MVSILNHLKFHLHDHLSKHSCCVADSSTLKDSLEITVQRKNANIVSLSVQEMKYVSTYPFQIRFGT